MTHLSAFHVPFAVKAGSLLLAAALVVLLALPVLSLGASVVA